MNIALCGRFNTDKKHQGGSAEVLLSLAERLSKNHSLTLFGRGKPTRNIVDMCEKNNIRYYYIPSDTLPNILLGPVRAISILKNNFADFDIIHTHNGSYAFATLFLSGKSKIVTHVHEIARLGDNPPAATLYLFMENLLIRFAAKKSDLVITHSFYTKMMLINKWKIKNAISIPIGIDTDAFQYKRRGDVDHVFQSRPLKLLYVGRLTRRKGIRELIESLSYLREVDATLCIIGNGELYSYVLHKASTESQIKFIQAIDNTELAYFYSAADLVVVPSHYEPAGLVPLEALSCGTSVLVASNTGLQEIGQAFFISEITPSFIANSIIESVKKISSERNKSNREYILTHHSWGQVIKEYECEYEKLVTPRT